MDYKWTSTSHIPDPRHKISIKSSDQLEQPIRDEVHETVRKFHHQPIRTHTNNLISFPNKHTSIPTCVQKCQRCFDFVETQTQSVWLQMKNWKKGNVKHLISKLWRFRLLLYVTKLFRISICGRSMTFTLINFNLVPNQTSTSFLVYNKPVLCIQITPVKNHFLPCSKTIQDL